MICARCQPFDSLFLSALTDRPLFFLHLTPLKKNVIQTPFPPSEVLNFLNFFTQRPQIWSIILDKRHNFYLNYPYYVKLGYQKTTISGLCHRKTPDFFVWASPKTWWYRRHLYITLKYECPFPGSTQMHNAADNFKIDLHFVFSSNLKSFLIDKTVKRYTLDKM